MNRIALLFIPFLLITSFHTSKKNATSNQWIQLFDGKSLEGWRAYNGNALPPGWGVVNGEMTFSTKMILEKEITILM
jgi:hypothetical protein